MSVKDWEHPTRCTECFAYVNPYFIYLENGKKFCCNFCGTVSPVPVEEYSPLAEDGFPIDKDERPYLTSLTYEFNVSHEYGPEWDGCGMTDSEDSYSVNAPPTFYTFIIDVSKSAYANDTVSQTIKAFTEWVPTMMTWLSNMAIILVSDRAHLVVKHQEATKPTIISLNHIQKWHTKVNVHKHSIMLDSRSYKGQYLQELHQIGAGIDPNPAPVMTQAALNQAIHIAQQYSYRLFKTHALQQWPGPDLSRLQYHKATFRYA